MTFNQNGKSRRLCVDGINKGRRVVKNLDQSLAKRKFRMPLCREDEKRKSEGKLKKQ